MLSLTDSQIFLVEVQSHCREMLIAECTLCDCASNMEKKHLQIEYETSKSNQTRGCRLVYEQHSVRIMHHVGSAVHCHDEALCTAQRSLP